MHLFAINIKCMQICIGVPSEKVHLPPIPAPINPKCTCFHFLLIFWLTDRENRMPLAQAGCTALARQASPRPVQCAINNKHRSFCWLRLKMGRYQFFCKIDTISNYRYDINLVSVYSWHRRQVGLYNKWVPHGEFSSVRFYRATHYTANRVIEVACRLPVCLSITLPDQEHIGWKSWKLIARTISPTSSLFIAQRQTKDG